MKKDKKTIRSILLRLNKDRLTAKFPQPADEVDAALRRLVEGAYGICVDCGSDISEARLTAVPEAARCLECESTRDGLLLSSSGNG